MPLGYGSRDKKLVVAEAEAERVRLIFRLYLELGSLGHLLPELRRRGVVTKLRQLTGGRTIGGIPFTRGSLAYLLRNRFYLGEVVHRGKVSQGEHPAILEPDLFEAVQDRLAQQHRRFVNARAGSNALLLGRLFDDRGNRMTPCYTRKKGVRYRYYVSCALAHARTETAGSVTRVAAVEVERHVLRALRERHPDRTDVVDRELVERCVERIVLHPAAIEVMPRSDPVGSGPNGVPEQAPAQQTGDSARSEIAGAIVGPSTIRIPWSRNATKRHRAIIVPERTEPRDFRPIRAETRTVLVRSIALGRRWLADLVTGVVVGPEEIAAHEGCSKRHVQMTISLAFLAPDLVKAAVEGRLPRGVGVARLLDPPVEWPRQWQMLGLRP